MKPFNQKLKERIVSVFGELNSDSLANEGWQVLQPRLNNHQPKKRMLLIAFPLYAKAASIMLLIGMGWVLNQQLIKHSNLVVPIAMETAATNSKATATESTIPAKPEQSAKPIRRVKTIKLNAPCAPIELTILPSSNTDTATTATLNEPINTNSALTTDTATLLSTIEPIVETKVAAGFFADVTDIGQPNTDMKKRGLDVGISSMLTIMDDAKTNSPGISVGVYSYHKISNKVAFSPGMKINVQDFNLPYIPSNTQSDYLAGDAINGDFSSGSVTSTDARVKVVSLEIPLNFTFTLFQVKKHRVSMSTGLSSLAYIQQSFQRNYDVKKNENIYNNANNTWEQVTVDKSYNVKDEYGAFSRLDLFKLVNLSIGYQIPFGKNAVTIEPFIQMPIGGVTSNNMYMGNGGLSVKYSIF